MELKDIVSIAGVSGLHKIIGRSKSGLILETIGTGKRFPTAIQDKVSVLDDISMFTESGDMRLSEVFAKLNEKDKGGEKVPTAKDDAKAQRSFVTEVIGIDNERVYDSDIKKLLNWFHALKTEMDLSKLPEEKAEGESDEKGEDAAEAVKKAEKTKTPKIAPPKNTAAKTSSKSAGGSKTTYRPKSV